MTQQEANKAVVRAYAQEFSRGDFEKVLELFATDAVIQGVLGSGGLDVALPVWQALHQAFAMRLDIEELIAEGEFVAARFIESGTFKAPFRGFEPTGKSYRLVAMEWFRLKDGKIVERWGARDSGALQKQIGANLQ